VPGDPTPRPSLWAPLTHPVFRALWIAGLASDFGAWMHEVGEGWLMTSLSPSPLSVALLQAADSLAIFAIAIPAGALADVVDRRRLAILAQAWLFVASATIGGLALAHRMTPATLIGLTFVMGVGAAFDTPLWQTIVAELVPRKDLSRAVTLGGLSVNLARAFAPAIGGLLIAAAGPPAVFLVNAATFPVVIVVLLRWKRVRPASLAPTERWLGAMQSGLRYTRNSPELVAAFVRTGATLFGGICLLALLPSFARGTLGLGSLGFGGLLGCMGAGAVVAATVLPQLEGKLSADAALSLGTVVFGAALAALAFAPHVALAAPAMVAGGFAWMALISSLNVSVQVATPSWARARVSSVYMVVFQGALVAGAVTWGAVASRTSVRIALACGAAATVASVAARLRFPLAREAPDFSPVAWPKPLLVCEPEVDAGPVLVTMTYRVPPARFAAFADAMRDLEHIRRREGAFDWRLYRDTAVADTYVEVYSIDSWAEHLRQHERVTVDERDAEKAAQALAEGFDESAVRHLVAVGDDEGEEEAADVDGDTAKDEETK
jgi:MFS family permease